MAGPGEALGERATELARLLTDDIAALEAIRRRWDDDWMADTDITDLWQNMPVGEVRDRVYVCGVGGLYVNRDSLIAEVNQAQDAALRLRSKLLAITEAVR